MKMVTLAVIITFLLNLALVAGLDAILYDEPFPKMLYGLLAMDGSTVKKSVYWFGAVSVAAAVVNDIRRSKERAGGSSPR
jgi:hypothetical protein